MDDFEPFNAAAQATYVERDGSGDITAQFATNGTLSIASDVIAIAAPTTGTLVTYKRLAYRNAAGLLLGLGPWVKQ